MNNHHLANTADNYFKQGSSMELKLMGKNMRNGILTWSQGISPQNSCYLQSEKQSTHSEGSWQRHNWTE